MANEPTNPSEMENKTLFKPSEMPSAIHELGEQLNSAKYGFEKIEEAIKYSKDGAQYESDLVIAKNTILEDNTYFEDIGEAIAEKDGGEVPDKSEMAGRIENIPTASAPVQNPALILWDWEGTKLAEYSREDALALTELPAPNTLPAYATADHELLLFQKWNWSLTNIKTWVQNYEGETLNVGAIYTTTDGQDHNYWGNPRLDTTTIITMQKRGTATIGNNAFQNCRSLTQINIPDSVTTIGNSAFSNCYSLTQINIPDSVTTIGSSAFECCYSLAQINIPDSITTIGSSAFSICYSLTQINIPDGVMYIGISAFYDCCSLIQINIPDSVITIGSSAFEYCYSLTQINIPDSVTIIGSSAFQYCKSLCDVLLESKPTLASSDAFSNIPTNYRIYVPRSVLPWFETATNWSSIYVDGHIVAIEDYIDYLESIGFNVDKYKEVES